MECEYDGFQKEISCSRTPFLQVKFDGVRLHKVFKRTQGMILAIHAIS